MLKDEGRSIEIPIDRRSELALEYQQNLYLVNPNDASLFEEHKARNRYVSWPMTKLPNYQSLCRKDVILNMLLIWSGCIVNSLCIMHYGVVHL